MISSDCPLLRLTLSKVTVATIDTLGRKPIQFGGFAILTVLFVIIGFAFDKLNASALLALYVVCFPITIDPNVR